MHDTIKIAVLAWVFLGGNPIWASEWQPSPKPADTSGYQATLAPTVNGTSIATPNVRNLPPAEKGVVANAEQIARSIEPFYGKPASDKLFTLLAGHYGAIKDHLDATVAGNAAQQEAAIKALTLNAGEISAFLSEANPYLPKDTVMALLTAHAAHHIQEFQQLKAGEYAAEADMWKGKRGGAPHRRATIAATREKSQLIEPRDGRRVDIRLRH